MIEMKCLHQPVQSEFFISACSSKSVVLFLSCTAMFRALSTRNCRGYEKLKEDESSALLEAKLSRARSLPAKIFSSSRKSTREQSAEAKSVTKQAKKVSKIHPMFSLFDPRLRKKAAAKPEFSRYLEYLKEGGIFGMNSSMPVIHER